MEDSIGKILLNSLLYLHFVHEPLLLHIFTFTGSQVVPKSHYRGHKLSLWLSLIPQLHSSFNIPELSMRHHHFSEENPMFYDGMVHCIAIRWTMELN